jgi:hypothetical protein
MESKLKVSPYSTNTSAPSGISSLILGLRIYDF